MALSVFNSRSAIAMAFFEPKRILAARLAGSENRQSHFQWLGLGLVGAAAAVIGFRRYPVLDERLLPLCMLELSLCLL